MRTIMSIAAICPLWKEPSYKMEMTSQLLFCEQAVVLEELENFTRVRCLFDDYEGWCMNNQIAEMPADTAFELKGYINETGTAALINNTPIHLPVASPVYSNIDCGLFKIEYPVNGYLHAEDIKANPEMAEELAMIFINTPYIWGGKSSFGIDCSGFAQKVFKMMGIHLPRDAYQQIAFGETVDFLQQCICGDLAFFDNENGDIIHVGMLLGSNSIIHASGYVRVDAIDNLGIVNAVTGKRTHRLRIIKRLF